MGPKRGTVPRGDRGQNQDGRGRGQQQGRGPGRQDGQTGQGAGRGHGSGTERGRPAGGRGSECQGQSPPQSHHHQQPGSVPLQPPQASVRSKTNPWNLPQVSDVASQLAATSIQPAAVASAPVLKPETVRSLDLQTVQQPDTRVENVQPVTMGQTSRGAQSLELAETDQKPKLLWQHNSNVKGSFANPYTSIKERQASLGRNRPGVAIGLYTNHFKINVSPTSVVYRYDVDVSFPDWKNREPRRSDMPLISRAFEELKRQNPNRVFKNGLKVAFDRRKNAYSPEELDFDGTFKASVTVPEVVDIPDRQVSVQFKLQKVGEFELKSAFDAYCSRGSSVEKPSDQINALNIIISNYASLNYVAVGRNFFPQDPEVKYLANGKSLWMGTFISPRLGWSIRLNVDMANKPAYEKSSLMDFIDIYLEQFGYYVNDVAWTKPDIVKKLTEELRTLKIRYKRPDHQVRDIKIIKILPGDSSIQFPLTNSATGKQEKVSVKDYFERLSPYPSYKLQYPYLPCVHVGNPNNKMYLPLELCTLKQQPCPSNKKLGDDEVREMIKHTAIQPMERKRRIESDLSLLKRESKKDDYAQAFGICIDDKMLQFTGRVLPPPTLSYRLSDSEKDPQGTVMPYNGKWMMQDKNKEQLKFCDGKKLAAWGILDLARTQSKVMDGFISELRKEGGLRGLNILPPIMIEKSDEDHLEEDFAWFYEELKKSCKPDLIMVIVWNKSTYLYEIVKFLGDTLYGIPTQVLLQKNIKTDNQKCYQTIHNICLKLNSKLGGVNQTIHRMSLPKILECPVMLLGADVTHASPGDVGKKPSIAAVVASCDPDALSRYFTIVSVQEKTENSQAVEMIIKMQEIVKGLLKKFYIETKGRKPQKIIYFRDGVSEGQFEQVLNKELCAIQRACKVLEEGYEPGITFLVVQKRHNTRFFPVVEDDKRLGRNKNVPPGTVVDTDITHPTETSYFLASHEGIQGTTRPTGYHLLFDDNGLSPDELQQLSFYLCHLYSRCERSVSLPAPTYYAHLVAFRARSHHNRLCQKFPGKDGIPEIPLEEIKKMEEIKIHNYFV